MGMPQPGMEQGGATQLDPNGVPVDVAQGVMEMLGSNDVNFAKGGGSPFAEMSAPVNLLQSGGMPPTAAGIKGNPRGLNRGGSANLNINQNSNPTSALMNRVFSPQRKK